MQGNVEQGYLELGVREKQRGGSEETSGRETSHGPWGVLRQTGISPGAKAEPKGFLPPDFFRLSLPKRDKGACAQSLQRALLLPRLSLPLPLKEKRNENSALLGAVSHWWCGAGISLPGA